MFVYGHADHNLSNSLVRDMMEMGNATLGSNINVVVIADWDASMKNTSASPEAAFETGTEWYLIKGGGQEPQLLSKEAEQNLDEPAVLTASIKKAFTDYPAKRYGLIMWDHGGAWDGGFGSDSQDGTATMPTGMPVPVIAEAVKAGLDGAGITGDRPLEFFAFDTCLMGTAEVSYALRDLSKVYIANAEIDYGDGWDYTTTLTYLSQNPEVTPIDFAKKEVELWEAQHLKAGIDDKELRAHAAFDTSKLEAVATATAGLAAAYNEAPDASLAIARSAFFSVPAYSATFDGGNPEPKYRDFGQFVGQLADNADLGAVATEAGKVRDALGALILANSRGDLRQNQVGYQLALPPSKSVKDPEFTEKYTNLAKAWNEPSSWGTMLTTLAGNADGDAPTVEHSVANGTDPSAASPPTLTITIQDADVASANAKLFARDPNDPNTVLNYGLVAFGAVEPAQTYEFAWDGKVAGVTDGTNFNPATVLPWITSAQNAQSGAASWLVLPGNCAEASGDKYVCYLAFKDDSPTVAAVIIQTSPGKLSAFDIAKAAEGFKGGTFTPTIIAINTTDNSTSTVEGTAMPWSDTPFTIDFQQAPAGQYMFLTTASDVWGNEAQVRDDVSVTTPF